MEVVFIIHSRTDRQLVEDELTPFLRENGFEPSYSHAVATSADEMNQEVLEKLKSADKHLAVLSNAAAQSEWFKDEIHWVVNNRPQRVVGVRTEEIPPDSFDRWIKREQQIEFTVNIERTRRRLLTALGRTPKSPWRWLARVVIEFALKGAASVTPFAGFVAGALVIGFLRLLGTRVTMPFSQGVTQVTVASAAYVAGCVGLIASIRLGNYLLNWFNPAGLRLWVENYEFSCKILFYLVSPLIMAVFCATGLARQEHGGEGLVLAASVVLSIVIWRTARLAFVRSGFNPHERLNQIVVAGMAPAVGVWGAFICVVTVRVDIGGSAEILTYAALFGYVTTGCVFLWCIKR